MTLNLDDKDEASSSSSSSDMDNSATVASSQTGLGSSQSWRMTSSLGGLMSDDCTTNREFCNFNRVHVAYCDGTSFAGDAAEEV